MSTPTFPSPLPPWSRPVQTPQIQTLTTDGDIVLSMDTTLLDQVTPKDADDPTAAYDLVLPDGNYQRQHKTIVILAQDVPNLPASFRVSGRFVGFTSLLFNGLGQSALLMWDGAGWHQIGGNATAEA